MTYLLDNNISFRFAHMLRALGVDAVAVRDVLPENADDVEILHWLTGRDCAFVSGDRHIRTRPPEVAALKESGVTALFFDRFWSKLSFWQQAAWLVTKWPQIEEFVLNVTAGACGKVQQRGRIAPL